MGQGFYIKNSSGKAVQKPNAHRLSAAIERQRLKGMSAATARVWQRIWQQGQRMSEPEHDARLHVPAERKVQPKQGHNLNLRKPRLSAPDQSPAHNDKGCGANYPSIRPRTLPRHAQPLSL